MQKRILKGSQFETDRHLPDVHFSAGERGDSKIATFKTQCGKQVLTRFAVGSWRYVSCMDCLEQKGKN